MNTNTDTDASVTKFRIKNYIYKFYLINFWNKMSI